MRQFIRPVLVVAAVAVAVLLLARPLPPQWSTPRLARVGDFGHFFLFGGLALGFWWLLGRRLLPAFVSAVVLNGLCEAGQFFSSRNADVPDFLRGLAGSLTVAVLVLAFRRPRSRARIGVLLVLALLLATWPILEGAPYVADMIDEYRHFPVLCDFRSPTQTTRWACRDAEVVHTTLPGRDNAPAARFTFCRPGAAVTIYPIVRDWSGYRRLHLELSTAGEPVPLTVMLRTVSGDNVVTREFHRGLGPDVRRVTIDLDSTAATSGEPLPGFSDVSCLTLAVDEAEKPRVVLAHQIHLE